MPWYQAVASGFVKSTSPMPACQRSHCHTEPSGRFTRIAGCRRLGEQRRALRDVGVDPHADPQVLLVQAREHAGRVGEDPRIPLEVAPVELAHPEAVEVEHRHRQLAARHLVDERGHGGLVVVGRERRRQPQPVRPRRHDRRTPGERRVAIEHLLGRRTGDHEVLEHFARTPRTARARPPPSRSRTRRARGRSRARRSRGWRGRTARSCTPARSRCRRRRSRCRPTGRS